MATVTDLQKVQGVSTRLTAWRVYLTDGESVRVAELIADNNADVSELASRRADQLWRNGETADTEQLTARKTVRSAALNKPNAANVRELQARIEALEAIVAELIAKD